MRVEVTDQNISEYGLDTITGNTREDLLAQARELELNGYSLFIKIPDIEGGDTDAPVERNIFSHYGPDLPDPEGATHLQEAIDLRNETYINDPCRYNMMIQKGDFIWICDKHDAPSKHSIVPGSLAPCLVVDPYDD